MNVHQIGNLDAYVRFLREHPHEIDLLFKELLISVTSFFRDPEGFAVLEQTLRASLSARPTDRPVRIWIPGCSTGEEAYSVAIAVRESLDETHSELPIQVFGTDLSVDVIDIARSGLYPDGIALDVGKQRLERWFSRENGGYRIRKEIREMVVLAPHDLIRDPPFTRMDLIVCRNVLIYLSAALQKRVLPLFHYSLSPDGILFLGPSESVTGFEDLFETLNKKWRIFRRKDCPAATYELPVFSAAPAHGSEAGQWASRSTTPSQPQMAKLIERDLLKRFAPATAVVNARGDILYLHGRTGQYLEPAAGHPPRMNVLEMAREGIQMALGSALRRAIRSDQQAVKERVRVRTNGDHLTLDLVVQQIEDPEPLRGLVRINFQPCLEQRAPAERAGQQDPSPKPGVRLQELERELQFTRESLQSAVEELESSNEELKSTNEELQSTNEELQSANEELETSREEMQSLNEELQTVNSELQCKVDDLSQANNDMQNLLNSTGIATMFLDEHLNVKRFTRQAQKLIRLIPTDIGRPVSDLASNLNYPTMVEDARNVLDSLVPNERRVCDNEGSWFLVRMMPYRTTENVIEGLVLTFLDYNTIMETEERLEWTAEFAEAIVETTMHPMIVLDSDLHVVSSNRAFRDAFRVSERQSREEPLAEIGCGAWDSAELHDLLASVATEDRVIDQFTIRHEFPRLGRREMRLSARRLRWGAGRPARILLGIEDVTDRPENDRPGASDGR